MKNKNDDHRLILPLFRTTQEEGFCSCGEWSTRASTYEVLMQAHTTHAIEASRKAARGES